MLDVRTETIIARPLDVVSSFAANPDNATLWYANIRKVEWVTPPGLAAGGKVTFTASFLGRQLVYTYEIIDFTPGKNLVMATSEGPFPMETSYAWESVGAGATRMVLRNRGRPSGFSKLLTPFMRMAVRAVNRKDLARLTRILESSRDAPHHS